MQTTLNFQRPNLIGRYYLLVFSVDGILPRALAGMEWFAGGNLNYLLIPEYVGCYYSGTQQFGLSFLIIIIYV